MSKPRLFVKLQAPTIELKILATDASKSKDVFYVGFKRYEVEEADAKLKEFGEIIKQGSSDGFKNSGLDNFIKDEIVYIKGAEVKYEDGSGTLCTLKIPDTRTVKPNAAFWESPGQCLSVLVDLYLASTPTKVALTSQVQQALLNGDFSGDALKN